MKSNKVELIIDTASHSEIIVSLEIDDNIHVKKQTLKRAQIVLPMIKELLKEHGLKPSDLTSIKVNQGPGSYTGLRVGLSVANTLSHFLKIPVNNLKLDKILEPIYS